MKKMFYCFGLLFVMNIAYHAHGSELPKFPTASAGNINSSKVVPSSAAIPNDSLKFTGSSFTEISSDDHIFNYRDILSQLGLEDEAFRQLWNKTCKTPTDTIRDKYEQLGLSGFFDSDFHNLSETSIGEKIDPDELYSSSQVNALSRLTAALRAFVSDKCSEVQHEKWHSTPERQHQQNNSKSRLEEIGENISREGEKGLNAFNRNVVQRFGGFVARGFK